LKPDYLEKFIFFSGQPDQQVIELPEIVQQKITLVLEDILKEGQNEAPIDDDLVRTLLLRLFIEVSRASSVSQNLNTNSYNHTLLKSFQNLIESHYAQLRLPKQYAELLYITPNHLNALCNDFLGVSAGTLIRERVILEAKRLLINLDLMVSEIAAKLNFDDQSYFIKFFKKYEGITPEKFRKLNTTNHGTN
ncbi:MAG: AraC family transcriptional regulator, partial [Pedobacter sp.]